VRRKGKGEGMGDSLLTEKKKKGEACASLNLGKGSTFVGKKGERKDPVYSPNSFTGKKRG